MQTKNLWDVIEWQALDVLEVALEKKKHVGWRSRALLKMAERKHSTAMEVWGLFRLLLTLSGTCAFTCYPNLLAFLQPWFLSGDTCLLQ